MFFALIAALGASVWSGTGYAFDMWVKIVVGPKHDCVHERILLGVAREYLLDTVFELEQ